MISSLPQTILIYPSNVADSVLSLEALTAIRAKFPATQPDIKFCCSSAAKRFVRRPRSKKKRIIAKWKNREGNWKPAIFRSDFNGRTVIVIHPILHRQLFPNPFKK